MKREEKHSNLTGDSIVRMLHWLDADRDCAGEKYEDIYLLLRRFFRQYNAEEDLVDETIKRVAARVPDMAAGYDGDPAFFLGAAKMVYLEYLRNSQQEGVSSNLKTTIIDAPQPTPARPPFNAEYVLYLLLQSEERDVVLGDLIETYGRVLERFDRRRADFWFYKQVAGSLFPLLRRALLRIGALVWLGKILRRFVS